MPLCRASAEDLHAQFLEQAQALQDAIQQIKLVAHQITQNNAQTHQMQQALRRMAQQKELLQHVKFLRGIGIGDMLVRMREALRRCDFKCQQRAVGAIAGESLEPSLRDAAAAKAVDQALSVPKATEKAPAVPKTVLFSLLKAQNQLARLETLQNAISLMSRALPEFAKTSAQKLQKYNQELYIYRRQTDQTKQTSERMTQLKIENAALREQIAGYAEFVQGDDAALLMKIEALGKQCESAREERRCKERDSSLLQQQVDSFLAQIDTYIDAEKIMADYEVSRGRVAALEAQFQACLAELTEIKRHSVSMAEYGRMKAEMAQKFDYYYQQAESVGKLSQSEIYSEYLALLKKINTGSQ